MYKPNNKKMLTVLIAVAMIFSAFAILSLAAQPAFASSAGTVTYNPTTLGVSSATEFGLSTSAFVSGGTFSSGATVFFYLSTTDSSTGLVATSGVFDAIGETTLGASSPTSLDQSVTFFPGGDVLASGAPPSYGATAQSTVLKPGTYYILASDVAPGFTSVSALTSYAFPSVATNIVKQTAVVAILNPLDSYALATGTDALLVGGTGIADGSNFDPGASVTVTLSYPGGTTLVSATADSSGSFLAAFTVPELAGTVDTSGSSIGAGGSSIAYTAVAQETNSFSSSFPQGGVTADGLFDVGPSLTVSPMDYNGAAGATLALTGTGFPAAGVIAASSSTSPLTTIEITSYSGSTVMTNTYHSSVTVSSTGQFSVSISTVTKITTTGPYGITISLSDSSPYASSITEFFTPAVFVSVPNPQSPGFFFDPVAISGSYYPTVNGVTAAVYDFPASASVSIFVGSTLFGTVVTDSNGFALSPVSTLPAMPSGSYIVTAVDSSIGLFAAPSSPTPLVGTSTSPLVLSSFFEATDPANNVLAIDSATLTSGSFTTATTGEYVPQNATLTVTAEGLSPGNLYYAIDGSIGNIAEYGTNVTVKVGTLAGAPNFAFLPASNGTLVFTYQPMYGYYGIATGTVSQISILGVSVPSALFGESAMGYGDIGAPVYTLSAQVGQPGTSITVTVSNLLLSGTNIAYYPGVTDEYNVYVGTTEITSVPPAKTLFSSSTLASGVTFDIPSMSNGAYNVSVTYESQPVSLALAPQTTADAILVVSTPGSSTSSGSMETMATYSDGSPTGGYAIVAYGLIASTPADLVIYTSAGLRTSSVISATGTYGGFIDLTDLASGGAILSSDAGGTYGLVLTVNPGSASASEIYSSYTVTASFAPGTFYNGVYILGDVNSLVGFSATGLNPNAEYVVVFNGTVLTSSATGLPQVYTSSQDGVAAGVFTVPVVYVSESTGYSVYSVSIAPLSNPTSAAATVTGLVLWPATITITPDPMAFPNELVSFTWMPSTEPTLTSVSPIDVTVYLNGAAYSTSLGTFDPATATIQGSFKMPNGMPNTIFPVSFGWSYTFGSDSVLGSALSSGTLSNSYIGTAMAPLELVNGTGASIVTISTAGIASIITTSVDKALAVPLSELSANITALHGDIATITTSFGTMTATLQAINATVSSVSSGVVLLQTDFGSVKTSLASLNATIVSLNGTMATISTSLGNIQTSVSSISATVTSISNGVATVQTSLGTLTGTVTSMNGTVATINTKLGTVTASIGNVSKTTSSLSTLEIFLIVAIVLILITLVIAFIAVNNTNRLSKKLEEQKKQ